MGKGRLLGLHFKFWLVSMNILNIYIYIYILVLTIKSQDLSNPADLYGT